jgi:hypothetical protein
MIPDLFAVTALLSILCVLFALWLNDGGNLA